MVSVAVAAAPRFVKRLAPSHLRFLREEPVPWGPLGFITYKRTYSRRRADLGRAEEWSDTVERCIQALLDYGMAVTDAELEDLVHYFHQLRCMPAGRGIWQLGTTTVGKIGAASLQNCFYVSLDELESFCFLFDSLMLGGGVGFSVLPSIVHRLPHVERAVRVTRRDTSDVDFIVPDNREGWVELLRRVLQALFVTGKDLTYSCHCIRSKGAPINGFGGVASGPDELARGIDQIVKILGRRAGKHVRPVDALDVATIIGSVVVAGNVRRCLPAGAMVHTRRGLVRIEEVRRGDQVLTAKGYRAVTAKFDQGVQRTVRVRTEDGILECTAKHRVAVLTSPTDYTWVAAGDLRLGDCLVSTRVKTDGVSTELPPCSYAQLQDSPTCIDIQPPPLDAAMAWLIGLFHANGYTFANLAENGSNAYVSLCLDEPSVAYKASDQLRRFGPLHVVVQSVKDVRRCVVRVQSKQLAWYFDKHVKTPDTPLEVPQWIAEARPDIRLAYVAGVLDGGSETTGCPLQVVSTVYLKFASDIQKLLYSCGIQSRLGDRRVCCGLPSSLWKVTLTSLAARQSIAACPELMKPVPVHQRPLAHRTYSCSSRELPAGSYTRATAAPRHVPVKVLAVEEGRDVATYDLEVEECHEFFCDGYLVHNSALLCAGHASDQDFLFAKRWDMGTIPGWRGMSNNTCVCNDVEALPEAFWEGYRGNGEPYGLFNRELSRSHGRIADGPNYRPDSRVDGLNPCGEQTLESWECCCLVETVLPNLRDASEFHKAASLVYKIAKTMISLPCHWPQTQTVVERNRRIGIGLTGIAQAHQFGPDDFGSVYRHLEELDRDYSRLVRLSPSNKLTTVKPSGTMSLLPGCTPGIHPAYAPYYLRRIRFAADDPLVRIARKHGFPVEHVVGLDGAVDPQTVCVAFPIQTSKNTMLAQHTSAVAQMQLQRQLQRHWSDNAVSATIYYRAEELPAIRQDLQEHYRAEVKSVSFLLHQNHGFRQAPYEEITQAQYEELANRTRPIVSLDTSGDDHEVLDGLECANGVCPTR